MLIISRVIDNLVKESAEINKIIVLKYNQKYKYSL